MDGEIYNRVHKSTYEVFIPWLENTQPDKTQKVTAFLAEVTEEGQDEWQCNSLLENQSFTEVQTLWEQFQDHLRHDNGGLSSLCMSYVYII